MNSIWVILTSIIIFVFAYRIYGEFIAKRIFKVNPDNKLPSFEMQDDIDYVPTNKEVLFGHHFASIAGTGPIVGPAIAVIWGWVPALIWVILGSIFAGAVHDYAALMMSVRNKGLSLAKLSKNVINNRVRLLLLIVVLFTLWIVVAIFGMVIAAIFKMYPQAVFPVWVQIPIAMVIGWLAYKKKFNLTVLSIVAVVLMYLSIIIGVHFPFVMPVIFGINPMTIWIIILFVYAYIASVLPVWTLLQPRDFVNSHQLIIGIALITLGVFVARPVMIAPALQLAPKGAPPILPFIFITIACGAISGFHSLVSSGTTSKQLKSEKNAKLIGYGGMLTEGFLAVLVIVAISAGLGMYTRTENGEILAGLQAWQHHYSSWSVAQGLTAKVTAFVNGAANLLNALSIPYKYGQAIVGVLIASFAGTTLDTATRIQRYMINELAHDANIKPLQKRHPATFVAVFSAALLAFSQGGGMGALSLWPMFGISNQLLAGLGLLIAAVYLMKRNINVWPILIPMLLMIVISSWAMIINLRIFMGTGKIGLAIICGVMFLLELWMICESAMYLVRMKRPGFGVRVSGSDRGM